jgi:hypothetical protein
VLTLTPTLNRMVAAVLNGGHYLAMRVIVIGQSLIRFAAFTLPKYSKILGSFVR